MLSCRPLRKLDRKENELSVPLATTIKGRHESVCVVCERLEYRKERSPRERDPCRARSCGTVQARVRDRCRPGECRVRTVLDLCTPPW